MDAHKPQAEATARASRRHFLRLYAWLEASVLTALVAVASYSVFTIISSGVTPGVVAVGLAALGIVLVARRLRWWASIRDVPLSASIPPPLDLEGPRLAARRAAAGVSGSRAPIGLALSGGGIRSASVSTGFLEELDRAQVLRRVDYLSTVSGGGWAGGAYTLSAHAPDETGTTAPWATIAERMTDRGAGFLARNGRDRLRLGAFFLRYFSWGLFVSAVMFGALAMLGVGAVALLSLSVRPAGFQDSLFGNEFLYSIFQHTNIAIDDITFGEALVPVSWQGIIGATGMLLFAVGSGLVFAATRAPQRGFEEVGIVLQRAGTGLTAIAVTALGLSVLPWRTWWVLGLALGLALAAVLPGASSRWRTLQRCGVVAMAVGIACGADRAVGLGCFIPVRWLPELFVNALELAATNDPEGGFLRAELSSRCIPGIHRGMFEYSYDGDRLVAVLLLLGAAPLGIVYLVAALDRRLAPSLHGWWSERITRGFLDGWTRPAGSSLSEAAAPSGPLHLVNAAFDARSSVQPWLRTVRVGQFVFGPRITGGAHVGWVASDAYASHIDYAGAIAVSAAAINALGGRAIPRWASRFLTVLHVRQGRWVPNPSRVTGRAPHPLLSFFRELVGHLDEQSPSLHLSDGGHEENLGLATLVERGCRMVIVLDAAHDPSATFSDLDFAFRRLGWAPEEPLSRARPHEALPGQSRLRVAREVVFSFKREHSGHDVDVFLAKLALTDELWRAVEGERSWTRFAGADEVFPQDPTRDQFFDAERVAAYREVGRLLARRLLARFGEPLAGAGGPAEASDNRREQEPLITEAG